MDQESSSVIGLQELRVGDPFTIHPVDVNGVVCASSFSPEVFLVLSMSLSALLMRPVTIVSSANLMMVLDPCTGLQWWAKGE